MAKRIPKMLLALLLVMSMLVTLAACGESETKKKYMNMSRDDSGGSESGEVSQESSDDIFHESTSDDFIDNSSDKSDVYEVPNGPSWGEEVEIPDNGGFLERENFGGTEVNVLTHSSWENDYVTYQVDADEEHYDSVVNAIYRRNKFIKEEYGIDINVVYPASGEDLVTMYLTDNMAGMNSYQAIVYPIYYLAPLAAEGFLKDINSIDNGYIRLDKEYWDQTLIKDVAINNKVFFLSGDALLQDDLSTWVMYFNLDLIKEYGLENPYDLVRDNEWTIDKMYEMLQKVELTQGANKSYEPWVGDKWGMVAQTYDFHQFMLGAEQRLVSNDGSVPTLRIMDEENVNTFEKIAGWFMYDTLNIGVADYYGNWDSGIYNNEIQIFTYGNALFMPNSLEKLMCMDFRETAVNYGILPMPKRSSLQENFASGTNSYTFDVIAIPSYLDGELLDATCYALEAMAYFGKELVTPEFYDRTLSFKRLKDDDSIEMLDIIFANRIYDLGSIFNFNSGDPNQGTLYFYTSLVSDRSDAIELLYDQMEYSYLVGIDTLIMQCYN